MANRRFRSQFRFGMEAMVVELFANISIGAAGAPTLNQSASKGVASVVRDSAGQYTITLQDKYNSLLHMNVLQDSGTSAPAAPFVVLEAESVSSNKQLTIQCRAVDNSTATDPASGESMLVKITLSNSSVA